MKSISKAVEEVVQSDMRVLDAIRMGIINNRKLAQQIQEEVSKTAEQNAGVSTIAVTLQRLGTRIKTESDRKYANIFKGSRLQLMDDISILYLKGQPRIDKPETKNGGFYVKVQGIGTTTVLVDDSSMDSIEYKKDELLKRLSSLSAIVITSPREIVETPGVIAHLMMALGGANINVVEVTSSYDNTFLIVDKKDSLKAVEIVRSLINRSKR
jgi:hypothetical protein